MIIEFKTYPQQRPPDFPNSTYHVAKTSRNRQTQKLNSTEYIRLNEKWLIMFKDAYKNLFLWCTS